MPTLGPKVYRYLISPTMGYLEAQGYGSQRWLVFQALSYLHGLSQPIIHRDLKPMNLRPGAFSRMTLNRNGSYTPSAPMYTTIGVKSRYPV